MSRNPRTLVALPYSPWSNKAQWALDVAGLDYAAETYLPMLGEPGLRRRIARSGAKVHKATVPVLFEAGRPALTDSFAIASRAAELAPDAQLMPAEHLDAIKRWNQRSEDALCALRGVMMAAVAADRGALLETLPPPLRLPLLGGLVARSGVAFFRRKYELTAAVAEHRAVLRQTLDDVRTALDGGEHLLGQPTYADLAMAVVLHVVPPAQMVLGPASRAVWHQADFAERYADLVAWRDRLIERRPPQWHRFGP